MERFNLKKANKVEAKGKYHVEVSDRWTLEVDINSDLETIGENIKISVKEGVGTSHMSNNRQMPVSRQLLVDFMSIVT
jgi:hypothetical protein